MVTLALWQLLRLVREYPWEPLLLSKAAPDRGKVRPLCRHDVMAEFSKWLEAGEESIFSLETEKNLPGASYELPEAAARTKIPRNKNFSDTACRIPIWPFVVVVKAGQRTPPEGLLQEKICRNIW